MVPEPAPGGLAEFAASLGISDLISAIVAGLVSIIAARFARPGGVAIQRFVAPILAVIVAVFRARGRIDVTDSAGALAESVASTDAGAHP